MRHVQQALEQGPEPGQVPRPAGPGGGAGGGKARLAEICGRPTLGQRVLLQTGSKPLPVDNSFIEKWKKLTLFGLKLSRKFQV